MLHVSFLYLQEVLTQFQKEMEIFGFSPMNI